MSKVIHCNMDFLCLVAHIDVLAQSCWIYWNTIPRRESDETIVLEFYETVWNTIRRRESDGAFSVSYYSWIGWSSGPNCRAVVGSFMWRWYRMLIQGQAGDTGTAINMQNTYMVSCHHIKLNQCRVAVSAAVALGNYLQMNASRCLMIRPPILSH